MNNQHYAICSIVLNNMATLLAPLIPISIYDANTIPPHLVDKVISWGILPDEKTQLTLDYANQHQLPIEIMENGFIRSVRGWGFPESSQTTGYSFMITKPNHVPYFDTTQPNLNPILQDIANLSYSPLSSSQLALARQCIDFIVKHNLTKYNHQPLLPLPHPLPNNQLKLLLIDQSYNDMSVELGQANDQSFVTMITDALARPNATLYLKLHPDTIAGQRGGYFKLPQIQQLIASHPDRIILIDYESNPLHTIKQVDEVYCVTSQFGFEALMCGKPVHCYGQPIYAPLINHSVSLEAFFYIMYIKHTIWIDPYTNKQTDITAFLNNFLRFIHDNSI